MAGSMISYVVSGLRGLSVQGQRDKWREKEIERDTWSSEVQHGKCQHWTFWNRHDIVEASISGRRFCV